MSNTTKGPTIFFKGLCLFCTRAVEGGREVVVRLPSTGHPDAPRDRRGHGVPHRAQVLVQKPGTAGTNLGDFDTRWLTGQEITFERSGKAATGPVGQASALKKLPSFGDFAAGLTLRKQVEMYTAATVHIGGGSIEAVGTPDEDTEWTFTELPAGSTQIKRNELAYWANWISDGASHIQVGSERVPLFGKVIISNLPPGRDPIPGPHWTGYPQPHDHHFRWYYSLLDSKSGSLTTQLTKLDGSPVPTVAALSAKGDTSKMKHGVGHHLLRPIADEYPTCFCAECDDDDDDDDGTDPS